MKEAIKNQGNKYSQRSSCPQKKLDNSINEVLHSIKLKVKLLGEEIQKQKIAHSDLNTQSNVFASQYNKLDEKFNEIKNKRESLCKDIESMEVQLQSEKDTIKNATIINSELNNQYYQLNKEYESQISNISDNERFKQQQRDTESTKNKDTIKTEEIKLDDLESAHQKLIAKRKELQKIIESSELTDSNRKKQFIEEENNISSMFQKIDLSK